MVLMGVWQRSHLKRGTLCAGDLAALRSIIRKVRWFRRHARIESVPTSKTRAASQRHTEHGHRQITSILDTFFHTDIDELKHAHPPREAEPECIGVKAHSGAKKAARAWQVLLRNKIFVSVGGNAKEMEPNAYHKAKC